MLRRTNAFYRSATDPSQLTLYEQFDGVEIAVDDEVAAYHRDGSRRMPARPLKISFGDRMLIVGEIDRVLHDGYWNA
jgi:hypothetical protein